MNPAPSITCPAKTGRAGIACGKGSRFAGETRSHWLYQCTANHVVRIEKPIGPQVGATWERPEVDPAAGEAAKREGMERVEYNAPERWKEAAAEALRLAATRHREFTTDIVVLLIPSELRNAAEPRALGPIMARGAADGLIEDTGKTEKSNLKSAHRRPKTLWRSLIYKRPTF